MPVYADKHSPFAKMMSPGSVRYALALACMALSMLPATVAAAASPETAKPGKPVTVSREEARGQYQRAVDALVSGDQMAALEKLENAASNGDYQARLLLVDRYRYRVWRLDASQIQQHAAQLRQAGDGGNAAAMIMLGLLKQYGAGAVRPEKQEALALYEKAAGLGNPLAMTLLGRLLEGEGAPEVASNRPQALSWYRKAVAAGDAQAMHSLADLYQKDTDEIRKMTAMELRQNAASLGYMPAILKLAECREAACADFAETAMRDGVPSGRAYQLLYVRADVREYSQVTPICQALEQYYLQQRELFDYPPEGAEETSSHLENCTLMYGYLPQARTRMLLLQNKEKRLEVSRRMSLEAMFKLEDFDEGGYPFTHKQRLEKKYDIERALKMEFTSQVLGYDCNPLLIGFPEGYDDLDNPARARSKWSQAKSIASRFGNCVEAYANRIASQPLDRMVPAYDLLTYPEKAKVLARYQEGLAAVQSQIQRGQMDVADELRLVAESQGRMQGAAEANKRAAAETRQWLKDFSNELAAAPAKAEQEMKRFAAALKGSTVEWEEEKARRAAEYQAMIYAVKEKAESEPINVSENSSSSSANRPSREHGARIVFPGGGGGGSRSASAPDRICYYYAEVSVWTSRKITEVPDTVVLLDVIPIPWRDRTGMVLGLQNAARDFVIAHHRELGIEPMVSDANPMSDGRCSEAGTQRERQQARNRLENRLKYKLDHEWMDHLKIFHGNWYAR
ncbi:MAG: tetratricopeptide repeat protein [Methanosarcina sp.]